MSRAVFATTVVVLCTIGLWPMAVALSVVPGWLFLVNRRRSRRGEAPLGRVVLGRWLGNIGVVSLILLALTIQQAAFSGAFWSPVQSTAHARTDGEGSDLYVLMLDGYPGSDVLETRFGFDNSDFDNELSKRGFDIATASRSNYTMTWLTLASFFQMGYVHELPSIRGLPKTGPEQYRMLGQLVNDASSLRALRDAGYRIASGRSAYAELALMNADEQMPGPTFTRFEEQLVERSPLVMVLGNWLAALQRDDVDRALEGIVSIAERGSAERVFVFDHVVSPHPPFIFDSDGSPRALPACFPISCSLRASSAREMAITREEYGKRLGAQIEYLNGRC